MMMLLMVISMIPLAFAEEDTSDTVRDIVEADVVGEEDTNEELSLTEKLRRQKRRERKLREKIMKNRRILIPSLHKGTFGEKALEVHKKRLAEALEKCKEKLDPVACKERIDERLERLGQLTDKQIDRVNRFAERRLRRAAEARGITSRAEFKKFVEEHKGEFKARRVSKQKAKNARERYLKAKENYKEHRQAFRERKQAFKESKDAARKACKEDKESEECQEAKNKVKVHAKESMQKAAETALAQLEKVKSRVEESESLSDEEATEILGKVDDKMAEMQDLQARIEALGEDATREEYQAVAKELRKVMKRLGKHIKSQVGKLVNGRMGGVIVRAKHLDAKLDRLLERMEEAGKDTTQVEPLVDEFHDALDAAHEAYKKAKDAFRINNAEAGHTALKEVHANLKNAHTILKEIVQAVKSEKSNDILEEVVEEELEDAEDKLEDAEEKLEDEDDEA